MMINICTLLPAAPLPDLSSASGQPAKIGWGGFNDIDEAVILFLGNPKGDILDLWLSLNYQTEYFQAYLREISLRQLARR